MSFVGSMHGNEVGKLIRPFLRDACTFYSAPDCKLVTARQLEPILHQAIRAKTQSTFCLEPPGFGFERKSIVDSISLGCIPVLFHLEDSFRMWPYQWEPAWRNTTYVYLPYEDVLASRIDVRAALMKIPRSQIDAMQRSIERNAHRFHVAYDEDGAGVGDGVSTIFHSIADSADKLAAGVVWDPR